MTEPFQSSRYLSPSFRRASRASRQRRRPFLTFLEGCLVAVSLVGIGAWGAGVHERSRFQDEARRELEQRAGVPGSTRGTAADGGLLVSWDDGKGPTAAAADEPIRLLPEQPFGTLEIPRLGLDVVIVEGTTNRALKNAVGHLESTAWPGQRGTSALAGHRDTFFRPLKDIMMSDTLAVVTPECRIEYVVDSLLVVKPEETEFLDAPHGDRLLLITCYPFYYVGHAPERFIVQARPLPERAG
jgi:sortase A